MRLRMPTSSPDLKRDYRVPRDPISSTCPRPQARGLALFRTRLRQAERADDDHLPGCELHVSVPNPLGMRSLVRAISAMRSLTAETATNYNRVLLPLTCFYQHSSRRRFLA